MVDDKVLEARKLESRELGGAIPDKWIASMDNSTDAECASLKAIVDKHCVLEEGDDEADGVVDAASEESLFEDDGECFVSFSCKKKKLQKVKSRIAKAGLEDVEIEEDFQIFAAGVGNWGLDRIDQRNLPLDNNFASSGYKGSGVDVYIVDTGCDGNHKEWRGRFTYGYDAVNEGGKQDKNGHGSHCAGIAAGNTYGVASSANVICVKVLGGDGSGSTSGVVAGLKWADSQAKKKKRPAVISMSLGGGSNKAMNKAAASAAKSNVVVVAAGNSNSDSCKFSPAGAGGKGRTGGVITVMATERNDRRAGYSNYGKCGDIFAPGSDITSAWKNGGKNTISGTSMACPFVTGVVATLLEKHGFNKQAAVNELFANAVGSKVKDAKSGSPTLLVLQASDYTGPPTQSPTLPPSFGPAKFCVGSLCPKFVESLFGNGMPNTHRLEGPLAQVEGNACSRSGNNAYRGKIALVWRGDCYFDQKVNNLQKDGALGVIIIQDSGAVPFAPGASGKFSPSIPSGMVSKSDGQRLLKLVGRSAFMGPEDAGDPGQENGGGSGGRRRRRKQRRRRKGRRGLADETTSESSEQGNPIM
jgi:hypothetical protein